MTSLRDQQAGRDAASFDDDRKEGRFDRSYFSALSDKPDCPFETARMAEVSRICDDAAAYVHAALTNRANHDKWAAIYAAKQVRRAAA